MAEEEEQEAQEEGAEDQAVQRKEDAGAEGGSGGSQKLVLIVLLVNAVALIALAVVAWMNLSKSQDQISLSDIEEGAQAEVQKSDDEAESSEATQDQYVNESFMVNLSGSSGNHFAKVDVAIHVQNDFVRDELVRMKPKIRDFIVVMLSSKSYEQVSTADGVEFLREEIRNKINGYLTKGEINDVLFTQFIVQ